MNVEALKVFRKLSERHSRAWRDYVNAMALGDEARAGDALAKKQEIEQVFFDCFVMVRAPKTENEGAA